MPTLYQTIITALIAAFIILFLGKTELRNKIIDYCDIIGISIVADMFECDFCLSFWTCTFITTCFYLFGFDFTLLNIICATPITRYLL